MATRILLLTGGLALASPGSAQLVFYRDVTATHLPSGLAGACMDAISGDVDGDGNIDLVLAMEFRPNILLMNDGTGAFSDASERLPRTTHDSEDIGLADFDDDGDLDLVFVSEDDGTDEFWLNDGTGRFTDASRRLGTQEVSNALAVMDLNGDGVPDLLIGNIGINRALISDGGGFRDETATRWPQENPSNTQDIEIADVNNDGDLDVIVGNEGQNQLFLKAEGRLVEVTAGHLPARTDETREIKAADLDSDGDLDLAVANVRFTMRESPRDYLLINNGAGAFTTAETTRFPEDARNNFTVQVMDLDRDGDVDALLPSTLFARDGIGDYLVLLNAGGGYFSAASPGNALPAEAGGNGFDIEVADFNNDGVMDLFFCNRASVPQPGAAAVSGGLQRLLLGIGRED